MALHGPLLTGPGRQSALADQRFAGKVLMASWAVCELQTNAGSAGSNRSLASGLQYGHPWQYSRPHFAAGRLKCCAMPGCYSHYWSLYCRIVGMDFPGMAAGCIFQPYSLNAVPCLACDIHCFCNVLFSCRHDLYGHDSWPFCAALQLNFKVLLHAGLCCDSHYLSPYCRLAGMVFPDMASGRILRHYS